MDVAVSCHTGCSLCDQTTMSSSHHTAKNIFHVEKYLMQTIGPGQTLHGTGAGSWCRHEAGLETAGTEAGDEAAVPRTRPRTSGGPVRRTRGGGAGHLSPVTPSRCHAVTIVTGDPCSHNILRQLSTSSFNLFKPRCFKLKNLFYILLFTTH